MTTAVVFLAAPKAWRSPDKPPGLGWDAVWRRSHLASALYSLIPFLFSIGAEIPMRMGNSWGGKGPLHPSATNLAHREVGPAIPVPLVERGVRSRIHGVPNFLLKCMYG